MMKRILCYGDSNTWGQVPLREFKKLRHSAEVRWPTGLQTILGSGFQVIEEGLNGRTTGPEDPLREGRSGLAYWRPCLDSHVPLDLVVIMLGTNDVKAKYQPVPKHICERMRVLVQITKELARTADDQPTPILLIAPAVLKRSAVYEDYQYEQLEANCLELNRLYKQLSLDERIHFLDGATHLEVSQHDGVHFEARVHQQFATVVAQTVRALFEGN